MTGGPAAGVGRPGSSGPERPSGRPGPSGWRQGRSVLQAAGHAGAGRSSSPPSGILRESVLGGPGRDGRCGGARQPPDAGPGATTMPRSEAQIAAARANGLKSRGPVTAEGKAVSRRNAYKHGMAGDGIVLPPSDSAEVERRSRAMQAEMAPKTEMGRFLVDRLAELTVRVQRCSRHERAATEARVLRADAVFDEA